MEDEEAKTAFSKLVFIARCTWAALTDQPKSSICRGRRRATIVRPALRHGRGLPRATQQGNGSGVRAKSEVPWSRGAVPIAIDDPPPTRRYVQPRGACDSARQLLGRSVEYVSRPSGLALGFQMTVRSDNSLCEASSSAPKNARAIGRRTPTGLRTASQSLLGVS